MDRTTKIQMLHGQFYDFWEQQKLVNGAVPDRVVHPGTILSLIPHMVKIRQCSAGLRFSVIGSSVVSEYRRDFTNYLIADHPHKPCARVYQSLINRIDEEQTLVMCHGRFCYPNLEHLHTQHSGFALSDQYGATVGYAILFTVDHSDYYHEMYHPTPPVDQDCRFSHAADRSDHRGSRRIALDHDPRDHRQGGATSST